MTMCHYSLKPLSLYPNFKLQEVVADLERSYHEHLDFHESQQESEKWLLQTSFKLMSHNSMNVSSMELTQRQIDKHRVINRTVA